MTMKKKQKKNQPKEMTLRKCIAKGQLIKNKCLKQLRLYFIEIGC